MDRIDLLNLTCCVLHNYLRKKCFAYISAEEEVSEQDPENQLTPLQRTVDRNSTNQAKLVREMFLDYFNGEGEVAWLSERVQ